MANGRLLAVFAFACCAYGALKDTYPYLIGPDEVQAASLTSSTYVRVTCDRVDAVGEVPSGHLFACTSGDLVVPVLADRIISSGTIDATVGVVSMAELQLPPELKQLKQRSDGIAIYLEVARHPKEVTLAILGCLSALVAIGLGVYFANDQIKRSRAA